MILKKIVYKILRFLFSFYYHMQYYEFRKKYDIDKTFIFNGESIRLYGDGAIVIGKNSYIGSYSTIQSSENCTVKIGNNCRISHNVRIYTENKDPDQDFSKKHLKTKKGNVNIEDNVWIGANVFINQGVKIGKNSIVGANSIVTRDILPFSICVVAFQQK